jgi:hypothetical protein
MRHWRSAGSHFSPPARTATSAPAEIDRVVGRDVAATDEDDGTRALLGDVGKEVEGYAGVLREVLETQMTSARSISSRISLQGAPRRTASIGRSKSWTFL